MSQVVFRCKQADEQRRKRDDTAEVYASFASEKVKKMPAVKNGFKIEIQCADIVIVEMQPYYFAFQLSVWNCFSAFCLI